MIFSDLGLFSLSFFHIVEAIQKEPCADPKTLSTIG